MSSCLLRIVAWCRYRLLLARHRWSRGGLTVRALRQLAQREVVPKTPNEERVLAALSTRISLDVGQVASDTRLAPGIVQEILSRYVENGTLKVEEDSLGYERYRLRDQIHVVPVR